jgi:orotidine-5'-phosphate decarboxylase
MMAAAREGVEEAVAAGSGDGKRPLITAVTVLTSIDQEAMNNEINVSGKVEEQVLRLAKLANDAGMDGIVCSAADLYAVKDKLPDDFMYVTPGIKGPKTAAGSDQKRVFTPGNAVSDGSSILVIGRAITAAPDRVQAGLEVLEDMAKVL